MSTQITPELSKSNKYYISRHRYYELKHFCLQYPEWQQALQDLSGPKSGELIFTLDKNLLQFSDQVFNEVTRREIIQSKIALVERAASLTDESLKHYILLAVTTGKSFEWLDSNARIPCSKNTFYDRYRKFFWILDKLYWYAGDGTR